MSFQKLAATILFVCLLLNVKHYAHSENMLEQLKELHLQKKQGWLTDQQFEEKKRAIIDSNNPSAKRRADEEAAKLAEKQKQEKILEDRKKREATSQALKEYGSKFPLHAAIQSFNSELIESLATKNPQQINLKDNLGKTAWDIAYEHSNMAAIPVLQTGLNTIKNAANVNVEVGINYSFGGWQPVTGENFLLLKKVEIVNQNCEKLLKANSSSVALLSQTGDSSHKHILINNIAEAVKIIRKFSPEIQRMETDSQGKCTFKSIPSGEYVLFGVSQTRGGCALWYYPIKVNKNDQSVLLDAKKAAIAF